MAAFAKQRTKAGTALGATKSGRSKSKLPSIDLSDKEAIENVQDGSLAWHKDLLKAPSLVRELLACSEVDLMKKLETILELPDSRTNARQAIRLDYFTAAFWFGKENGFSEMSLSAMFTILHQLWENCVDKGFSLPQNVAFFQSTLAAHTAADDDALMDFEAAKAALLVDHVATGLFQHYVLYQELAQAPNFTPATATVSIVEVPDLPPLELATLQVGEVEKA